VPKNYIVFIQRVVPVGISNLTPVRALPIADAGTFSQAATAGCRRAAGATDRAAQWGARDLNSRGRVTKTLESIGASINKCTAKNHSAVTRSLAVIAFELIAVTSCVVGYDAGGNWGIA